MDSVFVGRDRELEALSTWYDDAGAAHARVVVVSGEAGIGKSRLLTSFVAQATAAGARTLEGRTTELDGAPAYWPWLQVLDQLDARPLLEAPAGTDPESERFARFESVTEALTRAASGGPLVVVLEDIHRADDASLRLLVHVTSRIANEQVLLIATHRSTPADQVRALSVTLDEITRLPGARQLALTGLKRDAVAKMLSPGAPTADVDGVLAASGGNPLFVGEIARHLMSGGAPSTVPRSIREAIRTRLDARSPGCVDTVRIAAIVGRTFDAGLVATASGRPAIECLTHIEEAVATGLVEATGRAGGFRFVHALVRDAVEATLGAAELPLLHRTVAEAIQKYEGTGNEQVAELARHWEAASVLGDRATAAQWCQRAAVVADEQLAWEEAARLFDRALELGGASAEPLDRYDRAIGSARARLHCDEITVAVARCVQAADAARDAGRADLFAEAALVPEARALPIPKLQDVALEALAALPHDDHARRARLHAHLTNISFYLDGASANEHSEHTQTEAAQTDDPNAEIAAIRARQMVLLAAEHAPERLVLARRLGELARSVGRPSVALWEPLWQFDALVELGRVADAAARLPLLRRCVGAVGSPIAHWHLARCEAVLAQATGRFSAALAHADTARQLFARLEGPLGAQGIYLGFLGSVAMHTGWTDELAASWNELDISQAPPFLGELPMLGPAMARAGIGDIHGARALYDRLSPAIGWQAPPAVWLHMHALRIALATVVGAVADLPPLIAALETHRTFHITSSGGAVSYEGPVELWLGIGAAALHQWERAIADLTLASDIASSGGTPAFAVHADVERAAALVARGHQGDADAALRLLRQARPEAERLGMGDFIRRCDDLLQRLLPDDGPLSPRELEVAALVAAGRTNKQIAGGLFVSERTAQNHVQHILTKLGLANRTQVASWYREHHPSTIERS